MMRKGWRGQSYRHSLAARGIKTNSPYMKEKGRFAKAMKSLADDGSNPTRNQEIPEFAAQSRLEFAEKVRMDANDELLEAQKDGRVSFKDIEDFWDRDFRVEFDDFMNKKFTAEQFQGNVRTKIQRVTKPVPVVGVSNEDHGSLIPKKQ